MRAESVVRSIGAAAVAAILVLAGAGEARAQDIGVEAGVGADIPLGEMADYWQVGPSFGLGMVADVSERVSLRADGELAFNAGSGLPGGAQAPDLTQFRYTGGIEMLFTDPGVEDWYTVVGVGAGGASLETDAFLLPGGEAADFDETHFTAYGAVRVGYRVSPHVAFSLRSRLYLTVMDREDTRVFSDLTGGLTEVPDEEFTLPTQIRAEFTF